METDYEDSGGQVDRILANSGLDAEQETGTVRPLAPGSSVLNGTVEAVVAVLPLAVRS